MINRLTIRPAVPGSVIRDPRTRRPLPDAGESVSDSSFWRRRLLDGDVVLVTDHIKPPAAETAAETMENTENAELQSDPE